ncbi:MAG TPA: serine/threonine-protein kinase [Streptosporangiaceae bacterium]|nr:serine/threonine-protein kinase [Streptosporangiaceae bacterium]
MKGVNTSGDRIGRYRLLQVLGEGGMGVVHLAADPEGRKVAVKVLRPQVANDATALRRLAREVDTMRRVHSPHVAEILDADVTAVKPYIVTQFVPGRTLEEWIFEHGALRGRALSRLSTGLASALAAIHGAGVIHRDLKPGNVMLVESGEPVLIDFGIAQAMDATRLTATGLVIGTPGYLAPEIIEGEEAGAPADVHSWASTLVYAATGRPPFGSGTFESIFYKIMQGEPDLDGVPEAMLPLVRAAMARHPAERPTAVMLLQLARRIDLDATITDHTRMDSPVRAFIPVPPQAPPPAPRQPYQQPSDFKGMLPPAAPPPTPTPPQPYRTPQARPRRQPDYPPYAQPQPYTPHTRPDQGGQDVAGQQPQAYDPHGRQQRPPEPPKPERRKPYGWYKVCSLAALVAVLGFASIIPVLTVAVVLIGVVVLRAMDRAAKTIESKRVRRGDRGGADFVSAFVRTPFALPRALLSSVLWAPLGLLAGGIIVLVLMAAHPAMRADQAISYGAMAVVALQFLGPGSTGPRRQMARIWGTFLPRPEPAAIVAVAVAVSAALLLGLGLKSTPDLQPLRFSTQGTTLNQLKASILGQFGLN